MAGREPRLCGSRGTESSLNYGGNLEVVPPHANAEEAFPLGRIVVGGGAGGTLEGIEHSDRMTPAQIDFMNAQGMQGPVIEVSSEWLAVGHIDEIFVFLPRRNPVEGRKDFFAVLASPTLAILELQNLENRGLGDLPVFEGRGAETTVAEILGDEALMEYQLKAQSRIDSVREALVDAIGLEDEDFVEVPVLYESMWYGKDFAVAYNPGIQNLVAANEVLLCQTLRDQWTQRTEEGSGDAPPEMRWRPPDIKLSLLMSLKATTSSWVKRTVVPILNALLLRAPGGSRSNELFLLNDNDGNAGYPHPELRRC